MTKEQVNIVYARVVAGVVIEKSGKYLLVQEAKKCPGKWNLPAGRVEEGDSFEKTAIKEAKEETGFDVELTSKIGIFHEQPEHAVKHAYRAKIVNGKLIVPKDELLDVKWFTLDEIEKMRDRLRESWVIDAIKKLA